ncbi:MAG: hypothetical protein ACTS5Y_07835 [Pollutimonas bauzanensis]|uniref:Uncharacterized protein n=1 Tax=Pollutimonas bauzanensis TaxID=658167 RepID=A0A1M5ZB48_9BURK|nr:hypothetical protein [Pollutimonas bauzanensis]SHI21447.1 hypothetical protein SAMN04488135_113118 [Pollutimonas bauzanensis]
MNALSHVVETLEHGLVLDVTVEDLQFRAYVVLSEPDINRVADFVPRDQFERDGDVHVAAIHQADEARGQIQDITFNMNPGDAAVFLCVNQQAYLDALEELGLAAPEPLN